MDFRTDAIKVLKRFSSFNWRRIFSDLQRAEACTYVYITVDRINVFLELKITTTDICILL